ncbi:hypothetical protein HELRODRAFT_164856 [Helobdella robusta]|uniref:Uncharacterized protein n=1 Tax=Helobdella robusta TaxID=6412 RepID=T1EVW3_HELRO|nr:hypothetical protein HELRODRAFT_164856 [Helobdella robusta]ESN92755.1 hypothetical protein HELRODRAFT_164856 [Helobdella robusta]
MVSLFFERVLRCTSMNNSTGKSKLPLKKYTAAVGLQFILSGNESDDKFMRYSLFSGYKILVHEPDMSVLSLRSGFQISYGEQVEIAVDVIKKINNLSKINRMKSPHGICDNSSGYNPIKCELECLAREVVSSCGCRPIFIEGGGNVSICDYYQEQICGTSVYLQYYANVSHKDNCFCPPMCHEITYKVSVDRSKISESFLSSNKNEMKSNYVKFLTKNDIHARVYFRDMQYTEISTLEEYSATALLSDLGGALGLFLGATFLTIVEIMDMLWDLFFHTYLKIIKKSTISSALEYDPNELPVVNYLPITGKVTDCDEAIKKDLSTDQLYFLKACLAVQRGRQASTDIDFLEKSLPGNITKANRILRLYMSREVASEPLRRVTHFILNFTDPLGSKLNQILLAKMPDVPCHSQAVERTIKDLSAASCRVYGRKSRHGMVLQSKKSRLEIPKIDSKKDFLTDIYTAPIKLLSQRRHHK